MIPVPISCFFPSGIYGIRLVKCFTQYLAQRKWFLFCMAYGEISSPAYSVYPYDSKYVGKRKQILLLLIELHRVITRPMLAYKESFT